jgi:pyruvate/2-oxoglutarate dehydrogenase complex dihydrolipoamide acyltransferase (E2) component
VRAVVARRMSESVSAAATSTTTFRVRADALVALIEDAEQGAAPGERKPSPLAFILKAAAGALLRHGRFNATVEPDGDALRIHDGVSIAVAMATDEGLMVPVIRDVDLLDVAGIARSLRDLSERARARSLKPDEVRGGTFTVSSTGGMERGNIVSTLPIINPPQTATMWVSRITEQPRVVDGQVVAGPEFTASMSFDHRFIDGADVTAFINDFTHLIEEGDLPI